VSRRVDAIINTALLAAAVCFACWTLVGAELSVSRGWTGAELLVRSIIDNKDNYMAATAANPVLVKAITSGSVYVLGDGISQLLSDKSGSGLAGLDRSRLGRSGAAGFFGHGPLSHVWYLLCDGAFEAIGVTAWWSLFPKIAVDQMLWGPFWNALYVVIVGLLKRDSLGTLKSAVGSTGIPLILAGLKLWIPVHIVTYGFVPQVRICCCWI
jgi:protein Mpv17